MNKLTKNTVDHTIHKINVIEYIRNLIILSIINVDL